MRPKGEDLAAFPDLSAESREAMAAIARWAAYPSGHRIVPLFREPADVLLMVKGLAKLSVVTSNGAERILDVYHPGEIIGARMDQRPDIWYEVTAMEFVRGLAVTRTEFLALARRCPDVLVVLTAGMERRVDRIMHHLLAATSIEVPVRLCQVLLEFSGNVETDDGFVPLAHHLTHETMAQIVGASRPHTSMALGRLEQAGAVRRNRRHNLLVHPERLQEIVA